MKLCQSDVNEGIGVQFQYMYNFQAEDISCPNYFRMLCVSRAIELVSSNQSVFLPFRSLIAEASGIEEHGLFAGRKRHGDVANYPNSNIFLDRKKASWVCRLFLRDLIIFIIQSEPIVKRRSTFSCQMSCPADFVGWRSRREREIHPSTLNEE